MPCYAMPHHPPTHSITQQNHPLHLGLKSLGFSPTAELLLPLRIANLAPATACGLSLPVITPFPLPFPPTLPGDTLLLFDGVTPTALPLG